MRGRINDLVGKWFGPVQVLRRAEEHLRTGRDISWIAKCVCGNEFVTLVSGLKAGYLCGCNRKKDLTGT